MGYNCTAEAGTPKTMRFFVDYARKTVGYNRNSLYTVANVDEQMVGWQDVSAIYRFDRQSLQMVVTQRAIKTGEAPPLHCEVVE